MNVRRTIVSILAVTLLAGASVRADVKSEERSQIKLAGMLGKLAGMFGGKAMDEGVISKVALKGNRKLTLNDYTGQIIDLDEEKIYELDVRNKTYTVKTFAEMRKQIEEAMKKAQQQADQAQPAPQRQAEPGKQPEVEVDFDLKETGQKKRVAGYDCREVVMTITVREKGKKLEESGGMVLTTSNWLTDAVVPTKETNEFDMKYAQKMFGGSVMASAQQTAQAMAMYPMMKPAMEKMQAEGRKLSGTSLAVDSKFEAVGNPNQSQGQQQTADEGGRPGAGGLIGGLGRRMMRRGKEDEKAAAEGKDGRALIMTMIQETLTIATDVSAADVAIPAGYKPK